MLVEKKALIETTEMATTPPSAHLNELLFEALDDEHFVSGLSPVAGELAGAASTAAAAAAAAASAAAAAAQGHREHVVLPPPAELRLSDSSPQHLQQPLQRAASQGEQQRSESTSKRGNSGEPRPIWQGAKSRELSSMAFSRGAREEHQASPIKPQPLFFRKTIP